MCYLTAAAGVAVLCDHGVAVEKDETKHCRTRSICKFMVGQRSD